MKTIKSFMITLFIMLMSVVNLQAQVKVDAIVDRTQMSEGDTFTLSVVVSSQNSMSVSEPRLSGLEGFNLLNSWTSNETSSTYTNGKFLSQIKKKFNYMLSPQGKGKLVIPSLTVSAGDKNYQTKPIKIQVIAGNKPLNKRRKVAPRNKQKSPFNFDPNDDDDIFSQLLRQRSQMLRGFRTEPVNPKLAFFIQVEVDKTTAYVGEQVTASWYLYTRNHISDIDTLKHPTLKGFWKEDIEMVTRLNFTNEIINGVAYKKALLSSFALFPINAGNAYVDEYKAKCTVLVSSGFGFGKPYSYTKSSEKVKINVLPLPANDKPANFSGAVGLFKLSAKVNQKTVKANQPITLKIRFEGRGNAKLIDLPSLNLPDNLELYDTKKDSKFHKNGTSYSDFEVLIIPRSEGEVIIPKIEVSLFDPVKKQYYTKSTSPIILNITHGDDSTGISSSPLAGDKTEEVVKKKTAQLVLNYEESKFNINPQIKAGAWALSYLSLLLFVLWRFKVEFGWGQINQNIYIKAQKRLNKIPQLIQKGLWREVGIEVTNIIYYIMGEMTHLGGANVPFDQLLQKAPPSLRHEVGEDLKKALNQFETIGFAPEEIVTAYRDQKYLKTEFAKVEKIILKAIKIGASIENETK